MSGGDVPSWVAAPTPRVADTAPRPDRPPAPWTLTAVVPVAGVAAVLEAAHVVGREELVPAFRGGLTLVVVLQVGLAELARRRSSGAALGLLVCQATVVLAALGRGFGDDRALFAGLAVTVAVLLAASLRAFPSPELPPIDHGAHP